MGTAQDKAHGLFGQAQDKAGQAQDKAGGLFGQAQDKAEGAKHDAKARWGFLVLHATLQCHCLLPRMRAGLISWPCLPA